MSSKNKHKLEKVYYKTAVPCFHCSKQLRKLSPNHSIHPNCYIGFIVIDSNGHHPIHLSCYEDYTENMIYYNELLEDLEYDDLEDLASSLTYTDLSFEIDYDGDV